MPVTDISKDLDNGESFSTTSDDWQLVPQSFFTWKPANQPWAHPVNRKWRRLAASSLTL